MSVFANGTNKQKVLACYLAMSLRHPHPVDLKYWVGMLDSGATPADLIDALFNAKFFQGKVSGQPRSVMINYIYQNMLNRDADAAGLEYWVSGGGASASIKDLIYSLDSEVTGVDLIAYQNRMKAVEYMSDNLVNAHYTYPIITYANLLQLEQDYLKQIGAYTNMNSFYDIWYKLSTTRRCFYKYGA